MLITDLRVESVVHDWAELREGDVVAYEYPDLQRATYVWALGDFEADSCREYPIEVETGQHFKRGGRIVSHSSHRLSHYEGFVLLNARWDFSREVFVSRTGEPEPFIEIPVY